MKITRKQLRQIVKEGLDIHLAPDDLDSMNPDEAYGTGYLKGQDMQCDHPDWSPTCTRNDIDVSSSVSKPTGNIKLARKFEQEASAKSAALSSAAKLANSLENDGTDVDDLVLSRVYTALLRMSRLLQGRTISGRYEDALAEFEIEPPDLTDSWHPRDVSLKKDAWSGGDNIEDPLDHAYFETGESNAGPHVAVSESVRMPKHQLRQIIKEELQVISERWIPMSSFPERGIPNYNTTSGDPNDGLVALNTKFNQLMTLVMVLNDNLTSRADVREIIDDALGETESGPQMTRAGRRDPLPAGSLDVDLSRSGPPEIE